MKYFVENVSDTPYVENRPSGPLNIPAKGKVEIVPVLNKDGKVGVEAKDIAESVAADSVSLRHPRGQLRVVMVQDTPPPTPTPTQVKKTSRK